MTRPQPPRLASWLLHHFASGPRRDSLIGDIVEQYQLGRSLTWYRRQVLAAVVIGSTTHVRTQPRRVLRALVLAATLPWFVATAGLLLMNGSSNHGGLTVLINMFILVYCSAGFGVLLVTITRSDEQLSLITVESRPLNAPAKGVV